MAQITISSAVRFANSRPAARSPAKMSGGGRLGRLSAFEQSERGHERALGYFRFRRALARAEREDAGATDGERDGTNHP